MITTLIVIAVLAAIVLTGGRFILTWDRAHGHVTFETTSRIIILPKLSWGRTGWGWYAAFMWLVGRVLVQRVTPEFTAEERAKKLEQIVRRTRNRAKAERRAS